MKVSVVVLKADKMIEFGSLSEFEAFYPWIVMISCSNLELVYSNCKGNYFRVLNELPWTSSSTKYDLMKTKSWPDGVM